MGRRLEILEPVFDPTDGTAQHAARMRNEYFLKIGSRFRAEAAADITCDHANVVFRNAEQYRKILSNGIMDLRRGPNRKSVAARIELGNAAAWLERKPRLPAEIECAPEAMRRPGHCRISIACGMCECGRDVAGP